jgi:hypothetical protein
VAGYHWLLILHKEHIFWVHNSNIAALWKGGGKGGSGGSVQGAGGHNDFSMVIEFWEVNVFLFLSILNLLVVFWPWRHVELQCY